MDERSLLRVVEFYLVLLSPRCLSSSFSLAHVQLQPLLKINTETHQYEPTAGPLCSVLMYVHTLPIRYHPQLFSSSEPGRRNEASSRVRKLEIVLTALVYFRTDTLSTRHVARDLWTYRKLTNIYLKNIYRRSMTDMFCLKRATMPRSASMKPCLR